MINEANTIQLKKGTDTQMGHICC